MDDLRDHERLWNSAEVRVPYKELVASRSATAGPRSAGAFAPIEQIRPLSNVRSRTEAGYLERHIRYKTICDTSS